jgi:hypothetical protein
MKRLELEQLIEHEIYEYLKNLQEKSVPEPYDRKKRRRMSSAQVSDRDKVGKKMKGNAKTVARFKKKYGDDWESYLWRSATSKALGGGFKKKSNTSDTAPSSTDSSDKGSPAKKKSTKIRSSSKKSKKKPRNKSDIKLNPSQKRNADAMYKQLKRLSGVNESVFMNYVQKLDERFSILAETQVAFDGPLMKKILHKMVEKLKPAGEQQ